MQIIMSSSWALIYATWLNLAHLSKFPEFMMSKTRSSSWNFIYIFPLITNCMWVFGCMHAKVCTVFLTDYFLSPWQHLVYTEHSLKELSLLLSCLSMWGGRWEAGQIFFYATIYWVSLPAPACPCSILPSHSGSRSTSEGSVKHNNH